jgi:hypothetical protein
LAGRKEFVGKGKRSRHGKLSQLQMRIVHPADSAACGLVLEAIAALQKAIKYLD